MENGIGFVPFIFVATSKFFIQKVANSGYLCIFAEKFRV